MTPPFSATSLALICLAAGLALAGCQPRTERSGIADLTPPDPEPPASASSAQDSADAAAAAAAIPPEFAGRWFVSAVFPVLARQASMADPHLGATLMIGTSEASDVNGQRCLAPQMQIARSTADLRLGPVSLAGLERLGIACKGRPFASYLLLPGTALDASYQAAAADTSFALVAERPEAHYLLERAEQVLLRAATLPAALAGEGRTATVPAASTPTQPKATPMAAKPVAPAADTPMVPAPLVPAPLVPAAPLALTPALPEPAPEIAPEIAAKPATAAATPKTGGTLPAAGSAIHLASYKGLSAAKRGWKVLLGDFDALDPLSPLYVTVDVPGKGEMVRLYATGNDSAELGKACQALQAKGAYCAVSR